MYKLLNSSFLHLSDSIEYKSCNLTLDINTSHTNYTNILQNYNDCGITKPDGSMTVSLRFQYLSYVQFHMLQNDFEKFIEAYNSSHYGLTTIPKINISIFYTDFKRYLCSSPLSLLDFILEHKHLILENYEKYFQFGLNELISKNLITDTILGHILIYITPEIFLELINIPQVLKLLHTKTSNIIKQILFSKYFIEYLKIFIQYNVSLDFLIFKTISVDIPKKPKYHSGTLLMYASYCNCNIDTIKFLVEYGFKIEEKNKKGYTAIDYANPENKIFLKNHVKEVIMKSRINYLLLHEGIIKKNLLIEEDDNPQLYYLKNDNIMREIARFILSD